MKKIKKISIIIFSIFVSISTFVYAEEKNTVEVYNAGDVPVLLKYANNYNAKTIHIYYKKDGKEYPVYYLEQSLEEPVNKIPSIIEISDKSIELGLWRVFINGYPYKSIDELECKNEQEAYTATQHAAYCYLNEGEIEKYTGVGEAGERTLNCMKKILDNAKKSTEIKIEEKPILIGTFNMKIGRRYAIISKYEKTKENITEEIPVEKKEESTKIPVEKTEKIKKVKKLPVTGM